MNQFDIPLDEDGKIIDFLTEAPLEPKPEEFVRQHYLRTLHHEYLYPKNALAREVTVYYGHKELLDKEGNPVRADIVVYSSAKACSERCRFDCYRVERTNSRAGVSPAEVQRLFTAHVKWRFIANRPLNLSSNSRDELKIEW